MKITKLLIATNNKGKFKEIAELLSEINIEAVPTFDFNIEEPEETGKTFAENSLLKAKYYAEKTNLIALADDSGLCIVNLDHKPGIHSARFAVNPQNNKKDFPLAFEKIFDELTQRKISINDKPQAYFVCNLALFDPITGLEVNFEGRVDGYLTHAKGDNGFGYDPIFIKNDMDQTFAEIDPILKEQISHRALAFKKIKNWLHQTSS